MLKLKTQNTNNVLDKPIKRDFSKYEIRKFRIALSKSFQKEKKAKNP